MSTILLNLPELYNAYKNWISRNPQHASDYEVTAKWISYIIAGRINNSHLVSELVYCLSNLLVLFNDRIISNSRQLELRSSSDKLKLCLSVIEYSEVFMELSARKLWGYRGKWLTILTVQLFKCIGRLLLIYHYKEPIIQTPPIPPLERRMLEQNKETNGYFPDRNLNNVSFKLKRSGRIVRKVESCPPLLFRDWKPLQLDSITDDNTKKIFQNQKLLAETIYILKPIVHLAALKYYGDYSWKPWLMSFIMDTSSLHLYRSYRKEMLSSLTPQQRLQLSKRTVILLLYLLKSPFYDKYSKDKVTALLTALSKYVPLAKLICTPLAQYLPFWQGTYFYMWST